MKKAQDYRLATSFLKGLDVLSLVARNNEGIAVSEVANRLDLPRSSISRIITTLESYGLIERLGKRCQVTGMFRAWTKANFYEHLADRHHTLLTNVAKRLNELVILGIVEGNRVRLIDHVESEQALRVSPGPLKEHRLESTAMGKLFLSLRPDLVEGIHNAPHQLAADLLKARQTGIAWNHEQTKQGIEVMAVWVDHPSATAPMLGVAWPSFRFDGQAAQQALHVIRDEMMKLELPVHHFPEPENLNHARPHPV